MPPKRHRIRGGGSVPAVARRPKPDEPDYDFSQRPTYDGGQISDIPDDIVKEDWTKVLKADTPSDREHYDNILQRLGYYNPALSDEDERHRCSYVWGLWPEFSLRRIWMVAGFAREEDWAKANPNLYKYIYYTLAYQATQVEKVVERSKLSVLMRVIPALQKDVGEFWIYDLGVFGNPWEQVSGRALIDNLGEILALHEVKDFRAAVGYAVLAKLRFGRLKTDPTARSTARSNKEFTPLPVFPLIRCDMSSDDKLKKQLEKVREERYPMPSDIDDVEKWFDLSTEQQEEWKAEWVADLMYEWQGQVELPRPSMLESHKHPSPLPPRPPGRARGSERPQIPPRPVRGSECTRLSKQLADAESELESARRKIRDLEESQKSLPQQHQTERQADAEALLELGKEFETFKSTAANTQAKLEAQLTEVRTSLKKYLRLPLELLSLVGQFALGDDNHATLANFSLTSHLLREELLPIMYETVVLSEKDPRCYAIFWGNTVTRNPFTFTKYAL
ncbi:hypothetical protein QFC19_000679 [Naganishia cerealis]|uniref:Uncharacterized protein n=1 Tax=Naganishia cerealis TaxID=610337 RepID=A0ACC2WLP2_9TREE|nr:hypothetical protein QFC19_000679 [Naganishia cerealis]